MYVPPGQLASPVGIAVGFDGRKVGSMVGIDDVVGMHVGSIVVGVSVGRNVGIKVDGEYVGVVVGLNDAGSIDG